MPSSSAEADATTVEKASILMRCVAEEASRQGAVALGECLDKAQHHGVAHALRRLPYAEY